VIPEPPRPLRPFINQFRKLREEEQELARRNPFVAEALEREKYEGHRLAVIARTVALGIIAILLPFINPHPNVLIYEALVLVFIALGWLQLRVARVGYSKMELLLIYVDLVLMTLVFTVPNPYLIEPVPTAYLYSLGNFIYFFVILATATLAYSWRTVWAIGTLVALLWLLGMAGVFFFGRQVPELSSAIAAALPGFALMAQEIDPNSVRMPIRVQEVVVFMLVAGILAVKGWRTNKLLMDQALIAEERANLSRYFPASLVDTLASTNHDVGAVRSQEIAVLFSDIVGFTAIAESNPADEVMALLRQYHACVERAIFQNNGTLDKYLGDGVMATFGTPEPGPDDAHNALQAARQIIRETSQLNDRRRGEGKTPFTVSVGIHYGPAILGDIGPDRRLEFAVVGDTVNVASRVEAATREFGCSYAVSDDLMRKVQTTNGSLATQTQDLELKKGIRLRGRETPIDVWMG